MDKGTEFRLRIGLWKPQTIPMKRLAEYMLQLSKLMGHEASVHFEGIEDGSAELVEWVEATAETKVSDRLRLVGSRDSEAPGDALKAYARLNELLRADNTSASLSSSDPAFKLLHFPGAEVPETPATSALTELTSIRGVLLKIGGRDETVPLEIQDPLTGEIYRCQTESRSMAQQLAQLLFHEIELFGTANWVMNYEERSWTLKKFVVEGFKKISAITMTEAIDELATTKSGWKALEAPYKYLKELRDDVENNHH
jgi:hypothetical protein